MNIVNVISKEELIKLHITKTSIAETLNKKLCAKWVISEIIETECCFSFREFLNGDTVGFFQYVKR